MENMYSFHIPRKMPCLLVSIILRETTRSLTFCLVMVVLLVFTSIMPVTAVNKDPENLGLGAPVQAGDVIICSTPIKSYLL